MKRWQFLLAALLLLGLVASYFLFLKKDKTPKLDEGALKGEVERTLEEKFGVLVPDDRDKAELIGKDGMGVATRSRMGGFDFDILSDLPPVSEGFYEVWLGRGDEFLPLGRLSLGKGGWMLSYESDRDLREYTRVIVSVESGFLGKAPGNIILNGSF